MTLFPGLRAGLVGLAFAGLAAGLSHASEPEAWRIDPERSSMRFAYVLIGSPAVGSFERFSGEGVFDPDAPESAALTFEVDMTSVRLRNMLETGFVQTVDWFDTDQHPRATFVLDGLSLDEAGAGAAMGRVTIKGIEKRLTLDLTLTFADGGARATGVVVFPRLDHEIGVGLTGALVDVDDDVEVRFDLFAAPDN